MTVLELVDSCAIAYDCRCCDGGGGEWRLCRCVARLPRDLDLKPMPHEVYIPYTLLLFSHHFPHRLNRDARTRVYRQVTHWQAQGRARARSVSHAGTVDAKIVLHFSMLMKACLFSRIAERMPACMSCLSSAILNSVSLFSSVIRSAICKRREKRELYPNIFIFSTFMVVKNCH